MNYRNFPPNPRMRDKSHLQYPLFFKRVSVVLQDEQLTFLCILFALIVIGNSLVVMAIALSPNRRSRMNIFMMNLAIAGEYSMMYAFVKNIALALLYGHLDDDLGYSRWNIE